MRTRGQCVRIQCARLTFQTARAGGYSMRRTYLHLGVLGLPHVSNDVERVSRVLDKKRRVLGTKQGDIMSGSAGKTMSSPHRSISSAFTVSVYIQFT